MTLTDAQIDRYSRQIVLPRIGGRGQERLLAARMLLAGDARDIEAPLAYFVGAGIGTIEVRVTGDQGTLAKKISEVHELNPNVTITIADQSQGRVDLAFVIVGSEAARKVVNEIANDRDVPALVIARLDAPGKIVVFPDTQGPRSGNATFGTRAEAAGFVAMIAATEAFKVLAGYAENPSRTTIEFYGYETIVRVQP